MRESYKFILQRNSIDIHLVLSVGVCKRRESKDNKDKEGNLPEVAVLVFPFVGSWQGRNIFCHPSCFHFQVYYPVNVLRNTALDYAPSDLCFLSDADLVPSYNIRQLLKNHSGRMKMNKEVTVFVLFSPNFGCWFLSLIVWCVFDFQVLVIPAFEFLEDTRDSYPTNKDELIEQLKRQSKRHHPHTW